jgi:hypothetical protein
LKRNQQENCLAKGDFARENSKALLPEAENK